MLSKSKFNIMKTKKQQVWEFERMTQKEKRNKAKEVLYQVKENASERAKRPFRLSRRTVILVSPKRYKELQRQREEVLI